MHVVYRVRSDPRIAGTVYETTDLSGLMVVVNNKIVSVLAAVCANARSAGPGF